MKKFVVGILISSSLVFGQIIGNFKSGYARDVKLSENGKIAYIGDGESGFQILNLNNPKYPKSIGSFKIAGGVESITISKDEKKAFVSYGNKGVYILDISDQYYPSLIGTFEVDDKAYSVTLSEDEKTLFVADGTAGIKILNIENPKKIKLIGSYQSLGTVYGITLSKKQNILFSSNGRGGVDVLDITNPSRPYLIINYNTDGSSNHTTLSKNENKLFVADGEKGLKILNILDLKRPKLVSEYLSKGFVWDISISNDEDIVFLTDTDVGLVALDIKVENRLKLIKFFSTPGTAKGIDIAKSDVKAVVADSTSGIQIISLDYKLEKGRIEQNLPPLRKTDKNKNYMDNGKNSKNLDALGKLELPNINGKYALIDKSDFTLAIVEDKEVVYQTKVGIGMDKCLPEEWGGACFSTKEGDFEIKWKVHDPEGVIWCIPKSMEQEPKYQKMIKKYNKRCFRNQIGNYALNFGGSYFIHGTKYSNSIGKKSSHGCVRVKNNEMEKVYSLLQNGDKLIIRK